MGLIIIGIIYSPISFFAAAAETAPQPEYVIKAAYLYNFAMFVEWPPETFPKPDSPVVIGILGREPFGPALENTIQSKRINGRPFVIRHYQKGQSIGNCHILFVSSGTQESVAELRARLKDKAVLIVGETPGFAQDGGNINLVVEDGKVKCEINLNAAKESELKISSKLLSLSRIVNGS